MTYPFQQQPVYGPQVQQVTYKSNNKKSAVPALLTGASIGAVGGAVLGASKKPKIFHNGVLSDEFIKNVHKNYIKTNEAAKNAFNETKGFIGKLGDVKTLDDLKTLVNSNEKAFADIKSSINLDNISTTNLKENVQVMKNNLKSKMDLNYQDLKNKILNCWNSEKKCFEKVDNVAEDVFKSIKKTDTPHLKTILKSAGIGAVLIGGIAFAVHKFMANKKDVSKQ